MNFEAITNNKKVLGAMAVATAALFTFNRVMDHKIRKMDLEEEEREKEKINYLKKKLPLSVLKKYSLSRN